MKVCVLFVCVVAVFWVEANADCPALEDPQGGDVVADGTTFFKNCSKYTCRNGAYLRLGCPLSRCRGQIGQTPYDYSKPYPQCCPKPICPEDSSSETSE